MDANASLLLGRFQNLYNFKTRPNDFQILKNISKEAFGPAVPLLTGQWKIPHNQDVVIAFGQREGRELKVETRGSKYSFDWILALVDPSGDLKEFVAVEVQTIDTTGSYQRQSWDVQNACKSPHIKPFEEPKLGKSSNFNFENVNKRILPQLITKGHILRLESLCKKGLFFVCPSPVYQRIVTRLGGPPKEYGLQNGAITFHHYGLDTTSSIEPYPLIFGGALTTTLDQVYLAFSSPNHLPEKDSYTKVVQKAVRERFEVHKQF